MGFSGQEYWSGLPFPPPGDRLDPGIEPMSSALQADSLPAEPLGPLQMLQEPGEGGRAQYNLELLLKCGQGPGKEDRPSKVWPDGKESQSLSLSHSYVLLLLLLSHSSMCTGVQTHTHIPRHSFTDSRTHFTSKAHSPWDSSEPTNSQSSNSEPTDSPQACGESCVLNPASDSSWLCLQRGWSLGPQGLGGLVGPGGGRDPPETMPLKALGSRPGNICFMACSQTHTPPTPTAAPTSHPCSPNWAALAAALAAAAAAAGPTPGDTEGAQGGSLHGSVSLNAQPILGFPVR